MTSWHSYPKLYNLGHSALTELLTGPVLVEEKLDGSQFSFGKFNGELKVRSKGVVMDIDSPEGMFNQAVATVKELADLLTDGWTYRGEYLQKPKHNALAYDRIPQKHVMIFDINTAEEAYLSYEEKAAESARIGLEVVPKIYEGEGLTQEQLQSMLDRVSALGGQKIEGIVIKNYAQFGRDKKALMGKHVSEAFKEVHKGKWRKSNPNNTDILQELGNAYRTPARWHKALQHLQEAGKLTWTPKDIGMALKEIQADVKAECEEEIKKELFAYAWPKISRDIIRGFPEWYKEQLLARQFEKTAS